jgi:Tol biopolymer transport system component
LSTCGAAKVAGADSSAELTFTRVNGERYSVWVANADGSSARKVIARAYGGRLSSDGRWLSYTRMHDSPSSGFIPVYVVRVVGGKPRRIGYALGGQWSPRGAKLAIIESDGLVVVNPSSGRRRELVAGRNLRHLGFSPDGRSVAYARHNGRSGKDYRSDIFAVRISDGVVTRLTQDGHSARPFWGPEWIVYQRLRWAGGLAPQGRLWLMRPDGSGKRMFARGAEGRWGGFPVFGLDPLALSEDGRHLLACQAFEFGCARVTFTVPGGKRYGFPALRLAEQQGAARPTDLSRDGTRVLLDVGSPHDNRNHGIYEVPFAGAKFRLLVRNAFDASWRN